MTRNKKMHSLGQVSDHSGAMPMHEMMAKSHLSQMPGMGKHMDQMSKEMAKMPKMKK